MDTLKDSWTEGSEKGQKIKKLKQFLGQEAVNEYVSSREYKSPEEYVVEQKGFASWNEFIETEGESPSFPIPSSPHLDCEPQGEWVDEKMLSKVVHLLDEGETVHYMWRGGTLDTEGSGAGESIYGNDRGRKSSLKGIFTAVTSKRVAIAIPQYLGDDERHIPYHLSLALI